MAGANLKVAIAGSTVFDIGSVSEQFTAAMILLLVADEGSLCMTPDQITSTSCLRGVG
jgi:hypothetical protein